MIKKSLVTCLIAGVTLGTVAISVKTQADSSKTTDKIVIEDNMGNIVEPVSPLPTSIKTVRGTNIPRTIKWLNGSASYTSEAFSGKGTRYGGYSFGTSNSSNKFKIKEYTGGFAIKCFTTAAYPENVTHVYNLPLSGSPYTITTSEYFYFAVDNPKNGQKYNVAAMP